jgi:hypothetical protein
VNNNENSVVGLQTLIILYNYTILAPVLALLEVVSAVVVVLFSTGKFKNWWIAGFCFAALWPGAWGTLAFYGMASRKGYWIGG